MARLLESAMPKGRGFERRGTPARSYFYGSARQQKGRKDVSTAEHAETNRRDFLYIATGAVEVQVDSLRIVSRSTPLPFQLDEENVDETLRLRYRWLDLALADRRRL